MNGSELINQALIAGLRISQYAIEWVLKSIE
jgi:hypothetical protein